MLLIHGSPTYFSLIIQQQATKSQLFGITYMDLFPLFCSTQITSLAKSWASKSFSCAL